MPDTHPPAQADEKARANVEAIADILKMRDEALFTGDAFEADDAERRETAEMILAALRTEGEAVACVACKGKGCEADWIGDDMRCVAVDCSTCGGTGLASPPPAPAAVKVKTLVWHECPALFGRTKLVAFDCFGNEFARIDLISITPEQIAEFKRQKQADYEASIRSSLLPPSPPAEALPSQTSGAEAKTWLERFRAGEKIIISYHGKKFDVLELYPHKPGHISVYAEGTGLPVVMREDGTYPGQAPIWLEALAKPASEPASGGVREAFDRGFTAGQQYQSATWHHLKDAVDRHAAWKNFAALSSPASSSPAEAEALPAGVEARIHAAIMAVERERLASIMPAGVDLPAGFEDDHRHIADRYAPAIAAALAASPAPVPAAPIDGNQDRSPLAIGEKVVAPDGNVGFIVNLWLHAGPLASEKGACVEFREDWRADYPVKLLRRPLSSSGSRISDAHSKSDPLPEPDKEG